MSQTCALLDSCGFFKKYQSSSDLACKGFIAKYCKGPQMSDCKRKQYREEHGSAPPDEMMPNGVSIKS